MAASCCASTSPTTTSAIVRRLREAGFVIVGTTTLPEFAVLPVSEARIFGPTRNPWDLQRTPGGSSGGAGAAVAAGMVPVAQGSDGGGSLRIPAACCGLVGLKSSRGRISPAPRLGDSSLSVDGVLTRTVADTAAILDVLAGYELGDATWAPAPARPFAAAAGQPPVSLAAGGASFGGLRIAATTLSPNPDAAVDEPCAAAVSDAAQLLRSLGHEVVEVDPPWQQPGLSELFGAVFAIDVSHSIVYAGAVAGREPSRAGHGADELGGLLDGAQPQRARRPRGGHPPADLRTRADRGSSTATTRC